MDDSRTISAGDVEGIPSPPWGALMALQDAIRRWEQDHWNVEKTNALDWALTVAHAKWANYILERRIYAWKTGREI